MKQRRIVAQPGQILIIDIGNTGIASFVTRLAEWAEPQRGSATEIYIRALSALVGVTDVEAVRIANEYARDHGFSTITTRNFRQWLPTALSAIFAKWVERHTPKGDEDVTQAQTT